MSDVSEDEWRDTMTRIFEKLDDLQYKKMVGFYEKPGFPSPTKMTAKFQKELPQKLIERFGIDGSISLVNKAMKEIPRNDPGVQNLLRPFMDKLGKDQEKQEAGSEQRSQPEKTDSSGPEEPEQNQDGSPEAAQSPQKTLNPDLRKTIRDLKVSGGLDQKLLAVKVVQKSDLCKYETKKNEKKFCFHLGAADETDAIKVLVYGSERFPAIQEGHFYTFRDVLMDPQEKVVKVTEKTRMSKTGPFDVPKNVELEAGKLILSPVYTIREVQTFNEKKEVSVEGTVKEIGAMEPIQLKSKLMKKDKLDFDLEDDTGSIRISLWGEDTRHLDGISVGDVIRVDNLKTNRFRDTVSLNSTGLTRTTKVQSAAVQNVVLTIIGIIKSDRISTELDVEINNQVKMLVVASPLLAEGFGLSLEDDFEDKLLEKIPFSAEAEIQGNKIRKLKAAA